MKTEDARLGMIVIRTIAGPSPWHAVGLEMRVTEIDHSILWGIIPGFTNGSCPWEATSCRPKLLKGMRVRGPGNLIRTVGCDEINGIITIDETSYYAQRGDKEMWEIIHDTPAPPKTRLPSDNNEGHLEMLAFFTASHSPNTCPKCGAPKGCKYHE